MALVRTTTRNEGGSENGETTEVVRVVDRTKSVVNQGGQPLTRPTRSAGVPMRAPVSTTAPASPKDFVNDTMAELKRVDWPTREERTAGTIVTILLLAFFSLYIFGLDNAINAIFSSLGILPTDAPK
ncbi:MAG TPA: preprotein translocase subunit SecE [Abditibacterium sp.]|jgi:preprotein translocase SecE subunit